MSIYNSPTLKQLAMQGLLRNESLAISSLDCMPIMLFPPLFEEAFKGRHTKILKAMVAAWPFPCLPVGALMKTPEVETLQAVLDGIDMLLTQKARPRRQKLQVLDLRNIHQDFWDVWAGRENGAHSEDSGRKKQGVKSLYRHALKQPLKMVTDLSLCFHLQEHQTCLLQWAQQRRGSVQLCCVKMEISDFPVETIREVLDIFRPHYIEELEVFTCKVLSFLGHFAPFLGQMRNLRKFHLSLNDLVMDRVDLDKCLYKFLTQFSKLNCLQHLYLNGIYFSSDNMKQLCRCLKTPLESLSISLCRLSQSPLKHLSRCPKLCQLKQLDLSGILLFTSHPTGLRVLLESVADTLQTLELEHCSLEDSHLSVLLPALSQCSQLTKVNFCDNSFSRSTLKGLLQCMANLKKLAIELYPAPQECYDHRYYVHVDTFTQLCSELLNMVMAKRQPKKIAFATPICLGCCQRYVYDTKTILCQCWQ
ncbi:PRAME family member 12-like [Meriones unguiculatus]|uniref:PRAME family member 12-like n=1 Tax=Meriones unguiculatus TaxID=10047 RepID=UPI00293E63FE|nr:PRAME family member 12-like [Meriones unguiculatus]